jgi:hypothetical protein
MTVAEPTAVQLESYYDSEAGTVTLLPADAEGSAIVSQWLTSDVALRLEAHR